MSKELYENAALSQAAYAVDLISGRVDVQRIAFVNNDVNVADAHFDNTLAERFPIVVTQVTDPVTGFSATVFKDTTSLTGNLTIAFRGTEGLDLADNVADAILATSGAAFDQIVSMYNWWQVISGTPEQFVDNIKKYTLGMDAIPENAVHLYGELVQFGDAFYLVPDSAVATGVPGSSGSVPILSLDTDAKLNVTGHSLGGHLAVSFKMLFSAVVDKGFTYNSPGIGINAVTQAFFSALNGSVLSNTPESFRHVIASEVADGTPFYATAGLHLTETERSTAIHLAIEDQVPGEGLPWPWGNHSIVVLNDALAVYDLLTELDPTLSADEFYDIFQASSNETYDTLEKIVTSVPWHRCSACPNQHSSLATVTATTSTKKFQRSRQTDNFS